MTFNSETARVKHNSGMSKSDIEQGFERLDPYADNAAFGYTNRSPESRGWRATQMPMEPVADDVGSD